MDLKNQYLKLAGMDYNVRPSAQFKPQDLTEKLDWYLYTDSLTAEPFQQGELPNPDRPSVGPFRSEKAAKTVRSLLGAVYDRSEIRHDRRDGWKNYIDAQPAAVGETVEVDPSLVYRVSGASQPAHGYWSQIRRVAGYGIKNKKTGDFMDTPYGVAFESREEAEEYISQNSPEQDRKTWKVVDWATECVAFGSSVEGFVLKHKKTGETKRARFMTQTSAEEYMNEKIPADERKHWEVSNVQLTKEALDSVGKPGFLIVNKTTNVAKSGPYDTREEAEEYLKRTTPGKEEDSKWKIVAHEPLGFDNKPNGNGVTESVILDEGKKTYGKKQNNPGILKAKAAVTNRGGAGGHKSEKDYDRKKEKATLRKEVKTMEGELTENQKFMLQSVRVINNGDKAGVKAGDNSSKAGGPEYKKPGYKHPDYETTTIPGQHAKLGREEEEGVDVPQQHGAFELPADVRQDIKDSIAHCRKMAEETPDDVINMKGHGDKSWWKNTADMLEKALNWLETGEEGNLKRAIILLQSWENARWWSWPPSLVKFMAHYGYGYKYPKLIDKFKEVKANLIPLP